MNKKIYYGICIILLLLSAYQLINFSFDNYFWCMLTVGTLVVWLWSRKDIIEIIAGFTNNKKTQQIPMKNKQTDKLPDLETKQEDSVKMFENQRNAYVELAKLCCSVENQEKILPFLSSLQYGQDTEGYDLLYYIIEFLYDNDYPFIVSFDWKQEIEDFEWWLNKMLQINYNGLKIDFPEYKKDDFIPNVFKPFNECLQKHNLQIAFIDTESDEYVFVLHKIADKERIIELIYNIGYDYFDTLEALGEKHWEIEQNRVKKIEKYDIQMFIFWFVILLLCPFFTYVTYKGFVKDGFSFWVIFTAVANIGFYYFSIINVLREISLYINHKKAKAVKGE